MEGNIKNLTACLFLIIIGLTMAPSDVTAASDPRFFGEYCGTFARNITARVKFLGITVATRRATVTAHINAQADYKETIARNGLVFGKGTAEINAEGDRQITERITEGTFPFVFSGTVLERSHLRGSGMMADQGPVTADAFLSTDGNSLHVSVSDNSVVLRKTLCDNRAPSAEIISPTATRFLWGQAITFVGRASDPDDTTFPPERLVWTSNRDGKIGEGSSIRKNFLSPGTHMVSFSVTDKGGLTRSVGKQIVIENNPPRGPRITSPTVRTFYVGDRISFRGWAQDRESGDLFGEALVWRSSLTPGILGTGRQIMTILPEGDHTITLTATDRDGLSSSASIALTVRPAPVGNTRPVIAITHPEDRTGMGDNECVTLVAESTDLQDGLITGSSIAWRGSYFDPRMGTDRTRSLGNGERVEMCNPPTTGRDTWHTISATAVDSGGLSSTDSIRIYVIPGGLI